MKTLIKNSGECLCGKIAFETEDYNPHYGCCHCTMCCKWGGSTLLSADCGSNVIFTKGENNIKRYDSSDWGQRGFCDTCGSHLFYFWHPEARYYMPIGLFNDSSQDHFSHEIYIDEKPDSYGFAGDRDRITSTDLLESIKDKL